LSPVTLLPLLVVLLLAMRRFPALPTILTGAALGIVMALLLQPERVAELAGDSDLGTALALVKGAWIALFDGYSAQTGNTLVDELLSRGGMSSMLSTVWLILSAMCFGAVLEHCGMLERLIASLLAAARSTGTLIASVVFTAIGVNVIAADQYLAIVLPGRMYRAEFERRGLHFKNLSRTVEDAGTITSPLVPWNTCGAYMAATLGIPTLVYLPFCFFNLVNPIVALIYGFRGFTIEKADSVAGERSTTGG
jgi:NhaC family Na+:H+ antiporter